MVNRGLINAELLRRLGRKKDEEENQSAGSNQQAATLTPTAYDHWNSFLNSSGVNDNAVTAQVRDWLMPDNQAKVADNFTTRFRDSRNENFDPQRTLVRNPFAPGSLHADLYEQGRTGVGNFKTSSALGQLGNWDAFVKLGLNDANVAEVARDDAYQKAVAAYQIGQADAPYNYDLYKDRNAGKGYSAFGGNAGEVDKFGLAYENVRAAEVTKLNRKEGRKDSKETLLAGDYASLSDEYIDEMIPKIGDYVAGLDTNIDSGTLYDQEFFQRLNAAEFMGDAYASEDLYDYAKAMFPDREWSADDFGANGDPDKIAMVTDAVNADIADLRAGKASKVLNAYDAIKGERMTAQKLLNDLLHEKESRAALAGFSERYAQGNSSADWGSMVGVDEKGTDIVDKMLYMNLMAKGRDSWDNEDDPAYQEAMAAFGGHQAYNDYSDEGYHLMTADEITLVNKVWNTTHDPVKTQEVLDAMASTLRTRRMSFDENLWAYRSDAYGDLVTDLASIPMQGYANLEGTVNAFQGMLGNEDVKDVNSGEWRTQGAVNAIRGWTGEKAYNSGGAWAKFLHDTGLAIGDEALKFLPSLAFGPGTQQALSAIAGFSQGTYGAYERGVDNPFVAAAEGAASAGIEALTENLGLDVPNTSAVRGSKHLLRNMAAEGLEEGASELLGQFTGEAIADLTGTYSANDLAYMDELMNSKETDRTKRHLAAQRAVADQNMEDVLYSTAVGGAVAGALSAPSAAGVSRQQRRTGSAISRNNNAGSLLEVAMSMDEGSEARQMAETFSEQAKRGKKLSNGQLGRLYAATAMDLDAQSAAVVTETMNDAIVEQMVDKGETEEVARRAAPILAKQLRGETLTKEDTKVLAQSEHGITMMEELNQYSQGGEEDGPKTGLFKRTAKGTQVTNEQIQEAENLLLEKGDSAKAAKRAAPLLARAVNGDMLTKAEQAELAQIPGGEETVAQLRDAETQRKELLKPAWVKDAESSQQAKEQQRAMDISTKGQSLLKTTMPSSNTAIQKSAKKAKTLTVKSDAETGVRNTTATPLGSKESVDIQRVEAGEDGVLRLQVKTADGSQKSMSYQQLSFKSESMGHVITHAIDNAAGNAELANLMVQGYTGGDSTEYLAQFDAAYRAGYDNAAVNVQSMTSFSKGISKEAFKLGQKQAQEAEQTRLKNIGKGMTGNGSVTIPDGVDVKQLSKTQRNQVAAVRTIAKATGINFTFFQSTANAHGLYEAENGSYDAATNSIRLDLNAGKNYRGDVAEYAILRTAAHEMTHYIEANSRENYAKMRQYIADEFARKGIDFNTRVQEKIDRSPVPLTRAGAIAEVVADGCEMMLQDSQAVQRLLQKDESLAGQIKKVLKEFVGRIRKAFENIRPGSKDAEALLEERDGLLHYADELVRLWDEGLVEAVETVQGNEKNSTTSKSTAQLSPRNTTYMEAVRNGDMATAQRLVDEAARAAGYTIRAYHGTRRSDRVGNVFRPDRATSGPMAFFTDNPDIAANYAKDKADTSLAYDEEYADYYSQFRVSRGGKSIKVQDMWRSLPYAEKQRIKEAGKHITWDEDMENIVWDDDATRGLGNWDAYTLNEHKGNAIEALIDTWLESGELYGREGDFIQVLELAGINGVEYRDPDARHEKVYDVYLRIRNPFNTAAVNEQFVHGFEQWYEQQQPGKYVRNSANADQWDKNSVTAERFAERLRDDINNGATHAWTSVPDSVTDYLKSLGHDGIQDQGGKNGGDLHTVWIPFASEQVKSAEPVVRDDDGNVIPLAERFNTAAKDIRYSVRDRNIVSYATNAYSGQVNMRSEYREGGNVLGYVDWSVYNDSPSIQYIEVNKNSRRRGIGRKLMQFIQKQYPGKSIDFGMTTPDGTAFLDAITYEEADQEVQAVQDKLTQKRAEIAIVESQLDKLYDAEDWDEANQLGEQWDQLNDEIFNLEKQLATDYNGRDAVRRMVNMEQAARMLDEYKGGHETLPVAWDVVDDFVAEYRGKKGVQSQAMELSDAHTQFSVRTKEPPKKVGIAYKVFYQKNGKLYPPMVANPGGADTPVGVWLDADIGVSAPPSKTGRLQVKAGGKGTQGGSGSLAFRPGWHLGDIPKATQFDRKNPANGVKELFPKDFVWAECEYAMDVDYQEEAMSYGYTENGKFRHSYAGLPRLPEDGYYHYRTNPDPKTVPWVITGAMKVTRILSREDVDAILAKNGVEPTKWQGENGEMELTGVGGNVQYSPRNSNDPEVTSIKDQLRKAQAELNNMAVVASVAAPDMTGWNKKKQKTWVLDNLKYTGYKVDVMDFGVIEFGEKQIDTSLDYLKREEEVAAFLALPKVLKRGMQVAGHDNHKGRQFDTVTFAAPVSINGVRGNMAVVVKKLGRNLYKTHRILMPDGSSFSYKDKKMQRRNLADGIPSETMAQVPRHNSADFSIQQRDEPVNENIKFSLRTPTPATTRDYLLSLPDTDLTTEGQKDAMRRYKAYVDELRGLEEQRATQEELAQTTTGDAQLAAKARAGNLTNQADRLRDKLRGMENSNVFRPLAAEARAVLEANRQLDIGKPVETVIKGMGGKVRNAEEKLIRFRKQVQEDRNTREKITATRKRITKMVKYLDTLRRKESDYKHVPEELKPTVNALVAAFAEHSSMVFNHKQAERLAAAYSKLQDLDSDLAEFYDEDVKKRIEFIADLMEAKRGKPITLAEMEIIEDVVSSIYTMVRRGNDVFLAFGEGQALDIAQITSDVADEMLARQDKRYRLNSKLEDDLNTLIVSGNLTPVYYFDNLGNSMMKRLGYDIMNGQDKYGLYQRDDRNTMGEIRRQYHYNDWKNDKPIVHNDVQFTKEQVLWVYATAKREATNELAQTHHLDEGGIVFEGGKVVGADGKERKVTTPMRLSDKDVQAITSTLTEEQKGYADAVVRHLSTTVGDRGNEVSMRMYGFRKYREQYYFPYKTAGDQRHQTSVSNVVSATNDARLKHQSFSNPLKKGANTPLVIGDFTAMATSHMNAMNTYAAMVIPVENMNRVLNRKTDVDGATTTIRALMAQKYGDPTKTYLETLLKDLNGGAQVDNRTGGWIDKTVGLYKKGAVVASASVVLQQWTSIFRAAYMVNPKHFLTSTFQKRDWDELVKYSGVATIKDMGRFDVSVGVGGSNWLAADADDFTIWEKARQMMKPTDWDTFKTRWDDAINFLPGYADQITWAHIWNAVKAEQAEQNPGMDTSSDAFLKQCAERFNDVINHTQVYDSTMTRSQLMRSKSAMDKMMTAFGAEPTVIINMVYDAMHNPSHKGRRGRMIVSAIATVALSQLFAAAMQALASAWRKDDDERKALEKFIDKWSYNFADNMNPFTLFPYVRDVWDTLFSKYEVERSDMALFSELKNAISKWDNDSYSPYRKVEEIAGTVAKFFGLPLKNVMRDFRGLYNAINSDWSSPSPTSLGYTVLDNVPLRANNAKSYYQRMEKAYASGDDERAQEIASYLEGKGTSANSVNDQLSGMLKSMLAAGNDAGVDAILADMAERGKTRDSGDMRRIINDLYKNGDVSWEQAKRLYKKHTTLNDANDLYWHKAELDYKGEGNYSAYRAAREALLAGDKKTYLAEKSKLLTHGKKGPNVMSETVTDLKDELLALYKTDPVEARKLREMIVWAYMECGKTKQSANKIIDGWFDDK